MMEHIVFVFLLLCVSVHTASSVKRSCREKAICVLKCGDETNDSVTWSRDVDGKREKILTFNKETSEVIKHLTDPDRRYTSGASLILSIFKFSPSDAGRYHCNGITVELSVNSETGITMIMKDNWTVTAAVAGSCVLGLVSLLLVWRCLSKKKGSTATTEQGPAENGESLDLVHIYESMYEISSAPQHGNEQITKDGIYYLATHPGIQITH